MEQYCSLSESYSFLFLSFPKREEPIHTIAGVASRGTASRAVEARLYCGRIHPVSQKHLAYRWGIRARAAAERLEGALDDSFASRVKYRVQSKHSQMTHNEWEWTWFELKRYFLMCVIGASVPMYSRRVDDIWHEMLMFTREYEQFCTGFSGELIHHAPHGEGNLPSGDERAWFDWLYGELFAVSPVSGKVWGPFFRKPLSPQRLEELEENSSAELLAQWFNTGTMERYADLRETADYLIGRLQSQLLASRSRDASTARLPGRGGGRGAGYDPAMAVTGVLSGLLIYHSICRPDAFEQEMNQAMSETEREANSGGSSAAGGEYSSLSGWNDDHSGGGSSCNSGSGSSDGGSSCSSSSCSSCSSCSS